MKKRTLKFAAYLLTTALLPTGCGTPSAPIDISKDDPQFIKHTAKQAQLLAIYDCVASDWQSEATPLGNGFIGAMVYGGIETDRIQINEHTLWSGSPGSDADYNGGAGRASRDENYRNLQYVRDTLQESMSDFTENHSTKADGENADCKSFGKDTVMLSAKAGESYVVNF